MLLQFPAEGLQYRAQRNEAISTFRSMCRLPVLRQYGFEAEDIGLYVASCHTCHHVTARLHAFTDLDPDLDINAFEAELSTRALDPAYGWIPPHCPACGIPKPQPISALFARYLPEVGLDFQVHLIRGGARITEVEYFAMNVAGEVRTLTRPADSIDFADTLGTPLSLRALWSSLIGRHAHADAVVAYPVQNGYYLGLRPFADSDAAVAALSEPFYKWIAEQQADGGYDVIANFRDREDDELDIPFTESYHAWLGGYANEIERGLIDTFMFVDSNSFIAAIDQQARIYGLQAVRDSGPDTLFIRLFGGEIDVRLNVGPLLFRIIHGGHTFQRGLKRYFKEELHAVSLAAELVKLVRAALPNHRVQVLRGHYLEVIDAHGARCGLVDAIRVATAYDLRHEGEFTTMIGEVAPGARPLPLTLGRPMAGQLSPVIPRKIASGAHPR